MPDVYEDSHTLQQDVTVDRQKIPSTRHANQNQRKEPEPISFEDLTDALPEAQSPPRDPGVDHSVEAWRQAILHSPPPVRPEARSKRRKPQRGESISDDPDDGVELTNTMTYIPRAGHNRSSPLSLSEEELAADLYNQAPAIIADESTPDPEKQFEGEEYEQENEDEVEDYPQPYEEHNQEGWDSKDMYGTVHDLYRPDLEPLSRPESAPETPLRISSEPDYYSEPESIPVPAKKPKTRTDSSQYFSKAVPDDSRQNYDAAVPKMKNVVKAVRVEDPFEGKQFLI